mmetsp:Transcript_90064/g.268673  ORF Transcript_90064/g.268673 Transcript_90064/m.268673 type:complete len:223 (-) Transcript_90064:533-1201(-)
MKGWFELLPERLRLRLLPSWAATRSSWGRTRPCVGQSLRKHGLGGPVDLEVQGSLVHTEFHELLCNRLHPWHWPTEEVLRIGAVQRKHVLDRLQLHQTFEVVRRSVVHALHVVGVRELVPDAAGEISRMGPGQPNEVVAEGVLAPVLRGVQPEHRAGLRRGAVLQGAQHPKDGGNADSGAEEYHGRIAIRGPELLAACKAEVAIGRGELHLVPNSDPVMKMD